MAVSTMRRIGMMMCQYLAKKPLGGFFVSSPIASSSSRGVSRYDGGGFLEALVGLIWTGIIWPTTSNETEAEVSNSIPSGFGCVGNVTEDGRFL